MKVCKLEYYVPKEYLEKVEHAVFSAGAGKIGNYDCCSWKTPGTGQFRPLENSNPFIGSKNRTETVEEYKVELICETDKISAVIDALKKAHPYETPAFQYWKVEIN